MSEKVSRTDCGFSEQAQQAGKGPSDNDHGTSKRPADSDIDSDAGNEKRPRAAPSIILNNAPPRTARVGPQYQAVVPPWPPVSQFQLQKLQKPDAPDSNTSKP